MRNGFERRAHQGASRKRLAGLDCFAAILTACWLGLPAILAAATVAPGPLLSIPEGGGFLLANDGVDQPPALPPGVETFSMRAPVRPSVSDASAEVPDDFTLPVRTIKELTLSNSVATGARVHLQGVVANAMPGKEFTLSDRTGMARVESTQTNRLSKGIFVDVVGQVSSGKSFPQLTQGHYRRLGVGLDTPREELSQVQRLALTGPKVKVLDRVELVRRLDPDAAAQGHPVLIRGVITYYNPASNDCFVQDDTGGIWIDTESTVEQGLDVRPGQWVQVEAYSAAGYAPSLVHPHFEILGVGRLPEANTSTLAYLLTGKEDSQWVKVVGVVRSVEKNEAGVFLDLEMGNGGRLKATIDGLGDPAELKSLIANKVQVQGVCGTLFNHKRQLIGVHLEVPDTNQLRVLYVSTTDLAAIPRRPIRDLMQYESHFQNERRVRVHGVVTRVVSAKSLFIHDGVDGLLAETQEEVNLKPGDAVDLVGFPTIGEFTPVLQNTLFVRTGTAPFPPVTTPTLEEVLEGKCDGDLIQLQATFLEQTTLPGEIVMTMDVSGSLFDARLPQSKGENPFRTLRHGTLLSLTGVCSVQVDEFRQPKSFRLLLRNQKDVKPIKTPMGWLLPYAYRLVGVLTIVSLAALVWIAMLRNRVQHQTALVREKMMQEAALEARYRDLFENANDLVFSVDLAGRWLSLNKAVERVFGASKAEITARTLFDFVGPAHREQVAAVFRGLQAGKAAATSEIEIVNHDGKLVTLEVSARPQMAGSTQTGLDCIARDISDRKQAEAELRATQAQLLTTSRLAGMAEVATSVLHNVGNVLTSVNVSATLVADRVKQSKATNISRVSDLLTENAGDLGAFLTNDARGKQLPSYLCQLAAHLDQERTMVVQEVASLQNNVEHIREIIARQQDYARVFGITEQVKVADLVEDALQMNNAALARHGVRLVREFDPSLHEMTVEKHKVLQILVNLIRNAKHACDESRQPEKQICVRTTGQNDRIRIEVIDNGVGIPAENLTRIFNHGFTTRKDGHGFGLHSGALTASELGGSLRVQSDGAGRGATFTLELPLQPRQDGPGLNGSKVL